MKHFLLSATMQDAALALGAWRRHPLVTLLPDYNFAKCIVTVRGDGSVTETILVLLAADGIAARELSSI